MTGGWGWGGQKKPATNTRAKEEKRGEYSRCNSKVSVRLGKVGGICVDYGVEGARRSPFGKAGGWGPVGQRKLDYSTPVA